MKGNTYLFLLLMMIITSCFKEEEAIPPFDRGERQSATIAMGNDYRNQIYFDLHQGNDLSTNHKLDYDLAFESSEKGYRILLNTSTFMQIAPTGKTIFEDVTSQSGLDFNFDPSSGNLDSTAVGNWFSINGSDTIFSRQVYVIDRGYDHLGRPLGFKKIVFEDLKAGFYHIRFANLDGSEEVQTRISKEKSYNFVYYSFNPEKNYQLLEPKQDQYTLLFTQYTTLLFTNAGDPYPYLVTGVLLNRYNTAVAFNNTMAFDEIDLESTENMEFTTRIDRIGYNWKDLSGDVESGNVLYEVRSDYNYIIRDHQGFYYKMRFVGFYNQAGDRGYPEIEFQKL